MNDNTSTIDKDLENEINELVASGKLTRRKDTPTDRYVSISAPIHYIPVPRLDDDGNELEIPRGAVASIIDGCIEYHIPYCTSKAHLKRQYKAAKQNSRGRRW